MKSIFDCYQAEDLRNYLWLAARFRPTLRIADAERLALTAVRYYKGDLQARARLSAQQALEARWYASLAAGKPDYSVYDDDHFVSDVWACWVVYSRKYLLALSTQLPTKGTVRSVIDLGCGFGYTTAALKELFSDARVVGTNLESSFQFCIASEIGRERGFAIAPRIQQRVDLVFASEYFEHHVRPVEHLQEVLRVGEPRYLVIANAFGSKSIGHFDEYQHGEERISAKAIGRVFNRYLRDNGYQQRKTGWWNNRPAFWERV